MMLPTSLWVALLVVQQTVAAPGQYTPHGRQKCTNPRVRKEWRALSVDERVGYTKALQCLMSKPAKFKQYFPVVESRYDDFVALHVNQTEQSSVQWTNPDGTMGSFTPKNSNGLTHGGMEHDDVHGSGSILPWHRYAITVFEDALSNECGWKGGVPYWNWFLDTPGGGGSFLKSPIFDHISGFGGNGIKVDPPGSSPYPVSKASNGGGCVPNGFLSTHPIRIGPYGKMEANNTRCLRRDLNPAAAQSASKKILSGILKSKNYAQFCTRLGALHSVGHGGIGGEMMDPFNSPNDPLFFLHHAMLDYLWATWEEQDPKRLSDYSAVPGDKFSAETQLSMGLFAPMRLVRDVMDTQNRDELGVLCFKYEGIPLERYNH